MGPLMVEDVAGAARWFAWSLQPELPREAVSVAVVPAEARLVVTVAGARGATLEAVRAGLAEVLPVTWALEVTCAG